jgi:hypothetical protein
LDHEGQITNGQRVIGPSESATTIRGITMTPCRSILFVLGFGANAPLDSTALVQ